MEDVLRRVRLSHHIKQLLHNSTYFKLLDIAEVDMDNEEDYQKLCTTEDGEGNEMKDHTGEDLTEDDAL